MTAARRGDRTAFAELSRQHVRMVHGLLLARVPRIDVDDLVQDVFLTAMRRLDSLRDPAAFPGWLAAIARNHAIDHLRRNGAAPAELPENLPAGESDGNEARAALEAVRTLPEAYRETSSAEHARVAGAGAQAIPSWPATSDSWNGEWLVRCP